MKYEFKPSFDKSLKGLDPGLKEAIRTACVEFIELIESQSSIRKGIGLKRLKNGYWEIRRGIGSRIIFRWKNDVIEFVLAGDHDSIKAFLRTI